MTFTAHSSTFKTTTAAPISVSSETEEKAFVADLAAAAFGAPFELNITHIGNVGTSGVLRYTTWPGTPATAISVAESREIGNNIHRILKYYLGSNYVVNDISQVKLDVLFRT